MHLNPTQPIEISRISNLVHNAFRKKDESVRYTHIKVTRSKGYNNNINDGGDNMYTADNICKMIEFLIDNIFVQFGGCLFRQLIVHSENEIITQSGMVENEIEPGMLQSNV